MAKCKHCYPSYQNCPYYCAEDDSCWPNPADHKKRLEDRRKKSEKMRTLSKKLEKMPL